MGWIPVKAKWWPVIAASLERPWTAEACMIDLRWHMDARWRTGVDRSKVRAVPSRRILASAWGWPDGRVRGLLRKPALWWDVQKWGAAELTQTEPKTSPAVTSSEPRANPELTQTEPEAYGQSSTNTLIEPKRNPELTQTEPKADPRGTQEEPTEHHTGIESQAQPQAPPEPEENKGPLKPGTRAYRLGAFKECNEFWQGYRERHHKLKRRSLKRSDSVKSSGGALWAMLGKGGKDTQKVVSVLKYLDKADTFRAQHYRETANCTLVTIKTHFDGLHEEAQNWEENPTPAKGQRNAGEYEGTKDDGIDDTSEETRLWWAERIAKAKAEKQQREQEQA